MKSVDVIIFKFRKLGIIRDLRFGIALRTTTFGLVPDLTLSLNRLKLADFFSLTSSFGLSVNL